MTKSRMDEISNIDQEYIWRPFTQMKDAPPPLTIKRAKGALLFDGEGKPLVDAISSWWVNLHGHCHPEMVEAVSRQVEELDHVIFAGFTHEPAALFSRELVELAPSNLSRVFYTDNGSTAVEVGVKMAIQYWSNLSQEGGQVVGHADSCSQERPKVRMAALEGSYHGDTFGAMSVAERGSFNAPFHDLLFETIYIDSPATPNHRAFEQLEEAASKGDIAAFIYEPLVQGAGGMKMYSPEDLERLLEICSRHNILTIADEVMTGFGRTGSLFASQQCSRKPDIMCLSKGITGGVLPLGATLCSQEIFDAFLGDRVTKTLFHGHSYTANPIALSAARASLRLTKGALQKEVPAIIESHKGFLQKLAQEPWASKVSAPRQRGTILAFEVVAGGGASYFSSIRDRLYESFMGRGVLLRPLGNTVYILPPYCITPKELNQVYDAILETISELSAGLSAGLGAE